MQRQKRNPLSMVAAFVLLVCAVPVIFPAAEGTEGELLREEYRPLLDVGSFAEGADGSPLQGWEVFLGEAWPEQKQPAPPETWSVGTVPAPGTETACCITSPEAVSLVSPAIFLDPGLQSVSGSVLASGPGEAAAMLLWMAEGSVMTTVPMRAAPPSPDGICRFNLSDTERPEGANGVRLVLIKRSGQGEPFCWQTARLSALFTYSPEVTLLHNRLGYEQVAPKRFTVKMNFPAVSGKFSLENAAGEVVFQAGLGDVGRIQGSDGATWDGYYVPGDFTDFEEEGEFILTVFVEECPPVSTPVRIRFNLLWEEAFLPAVLPFRDHRAGSMTEADFIRLWVDPGLNAGSDAALLWSLVQSWSLLRGRYPQDPPLLALEEEAFYGTGVLADWILKGNASRVIGHEDYGLYLNALSCIARYRKDAGTILEAARLLLMPSLEQKHQGAWCFCAALDLHAATGEEIWLNYAKEIYPGISLERVESLLDFEDLTDTPVTPHLKEAFAKKADPLLTSADNPFGLVRSGELGGRGFFIWNEGAGLPLLGNSPRLFAAVQTVSQAYRYSAQKEYLVFVYDQLNWVLGNNPFGACLITGMCGGVEPPVLAAEKATAGLVLHGIGPQAACSDLPKFHKAPGGEVDENTQGFSLQNNALYVRALAFLKRIPVGRPK